MRIYASKRCNTPRQQGKYIAAGNTTSIHKQKKNARERREFLLPPYSRKNKIRKKSRC